MNDYLSFAQALLIQSDRIVHYVMGIFYNCRTIPKNDR